MSRFLNVRKFIAIPSQRKLNFAFIAFFIKISHRKRKSSGAIFFCLLVEIFLYCGDSLAKGRMTVAEHNVDF